MKLKFFNLLTCLVLLACESNPVSQDDITVTVQVSGTIGLESSHINRVGLFPRNYLNWHLAIKDDNTAPVAVSEVSDGVWTIDLSEVPAEWWLNIIGWEDLDGDNLYDPLSGESTAFCHLSSDTITQISMGHGESGWFIGTTGAIEEIDEEYDGDLFLFDDTRALPIFNWVMKDSTYRLSSGSAKIFSSSPDGLTITLRGRHPDTTRTNDYYSTVSIELPERGIRTFQPGDLNASVNGSNSVWSTALFGNLGRMGLTHIDTSSGGRVRGWVAIESLDGFNPVEIKARIYGTFDVPFLSE